MCEQYGCIHACERFCIQPCLCAFLFLGGWSVSVCGAGGSRGALPPPVELTTSSCCAT